MPQRRAVVGSEVGLHARPAALFARAAAAQPMQISISVPAREGHQGRGPVNAASILGLMTLGAKHGDEVLITADGDGADAALDALVDLVAGELDAG